MMDFCAAKPEEICRDEEHGILGLAISEKACYNILRTCGCSSSVERQLPKLHRWVRLPSAAPKKRDTLCVSLFFGALPFCRRQNGPPAGGLIEIPQEEPRVPPADTPLLRGSFQPVRRGLLPGGLRQGRGDALRGRGDGGAEARGQAKVFWMVLRSRRFSTQFSVYPQPQQT